MSAPNRFQTVIIIGLVIVASALLVLGIQIASSPIVVVQNDIESNTSATDNQVSTATDPIPTTPLSTAPEQRGKYHTHPATSSHPEEQDLIPEEIQVYIEQRRIPKSELKPVTLPNGNQVIPLKGQYEHVTIAVAQPDGSIRIVERQIEPLPDNAQPNPTGTLSASTEAQQ